MLKRLADRLVLKPSTHPIESLNSVRSSFRFGKGELEIWVDRVKPSNVGPNTGKLLLIKFPGTGGRAERASTHPAECWGGDTVTWTINPMGYGGSTGPATLQRYPDMIQAIGQRATNKEPDRRIVVSGNSLGGMSALALASNFDVAGLLLRNPAPVHQLIGQRTRYVLPTFGTSKLVAAAIPDFLNCVTNAANCKCPCWMVTCEEDQVVPFNFQSMVWENLPGPKNRFLIPNAKHETPVPQELANQYVAWIRELGRHIASLP
jgi:alpha-beta hydrolase superfamily lysophospholipase